MMPFEYSEVDSPDGVTVWKLSGDLYGDPQAFAFQAQVRQRMGSGRGHIVLDLGAVRRIDSSGIGILVTLLFETTHSGGAMCLVALSPAVEKALGITMLLDRIGRADSIEQAIASFGSDGDKE